MDRNDAYGDDVSDDEKRELEELMQSDHVPEPDEKEGDDLYADDAQQQPPVDDDSAYDDDAGDQKQPEPKADDQRKPEPKDDQPSDDSDDDTDDLQAFLEKHKGKSQEELAKLAFQQSKRANRASYDSRQASERLNGVLERVQAAKQAKLEALAKEREEFEKKLAEDPDAALREQRERELSREAQAAESEAAQEEFRARAYEAAQLASAAIPDFEKRAPAIRQFGTEMGFTPEEVGSIVDGRQIVTLHLASIAGNMIKSGLIDVTGQFLQLPTEFQRQDDPPPQQQQQQKRNGFARQPARGAGNQQSLEQRLASVEAMSDEDFDNLDPAELDRLLKEAEEA